MNQHYDSLITHTHIAGHRHASMGHHAHTSIYNEQNTMYCIKMINIIL